MAEEEVIGGSGSQEAMEEIPSTLQDEVNSANNGIPDGTHDGQEDGSDGFQHVTANEEAVHEHVEGTPKQFPKRELKKDSYVLKEGFKAFNT